MKSLANYIFTISILLSGICVLSARPTIEKSTYSFAKKPKGVKKVVLAKKNKDVQYITSLSGIHILDFEINIPLLETEEKEDEDDKELRLTTSNYFTTTSLVPSLEHFYFPDKKRLLFERHFAYPSSDRYLVFQVFRI